MGYIRRSQLAYWSSDVIVPEGHVSITYNSSQDYGDGVVARSVSSLASGRVRPRASSRGSRVRNETILGAQIHWEI